MRLVVQNEQLRFGATAGFLSYEESTVKGLFTKLLIPVGSIFIHFLDGGLVLGRKAGRPFEKVSFGRSDWVMNVVEKLVLASLA